MLNLTKLGSWEACSIAKNIAKVWYHLGNMDIVLDHENFKGSNHVCSMVYTLQMCMGSVTASSSNIKRLENLSDFNSNISGKSYSSSQQRCFKGGRLT